MKAADIMSTHLVTATPDTPVAELVRLMSGRDASAVPIVQDGRLVGLVTQADLIRALAGQGAAHTGVIDPDRRIRDAFLALLAQPPWSEAASNPTVVVRDGVVHLSGPVDSEADRQALVALARTVAGVRQVEDHMTTLRRDDPFDRPNWPAPRRP